MCSCEFRRLEEVQCTMWSDMTVLWELPLVVVFPLCGNSGTGLHQCSLRHSSRNPALSDSMASFVNWPARIGFSVTPLAQAHYQAVLKSCFPHSSLIGAPASASWKGPIIGPSEKCFLMSFLPLKKTLLFFSRPGLASAGQTAKTAPPWRHRSRRIYIRA